MFEIDFNKTISNDIRDYWISKAKTKELYSAVVRQLRNERLSLETLQDCSHFFFMCFQEKEDSELYERFLETMNIGLKSYWGPSATAEPDFLKKKFFCKHNDGRELFI